MKTNLNTLIRPLGAAAFLNLYKINQPFVVHHNIEELKGLIDLPFLASLETLMRSWPSSVQVHLPDARDEISALDTSTRDAQKLFDNGMGLLFNDANHVFPELQGWVDQLRLDLGLSALTFGRSLIYATPHGKGTAPHFDQNINFVLQIHGTKKWTLAPNHSVTNPLVRHTMGHGIDPEMMTYLEEPMIEEMPKETISFELKPGSLLFVPRGVWHSTEAEGHALSLNFTFSAPTWVDLFLSALRSRLILSPEWRETADGVNDSERRFEAEKKFNELLGALVQDLPHWEASAILEATEGN